MTYNGVTLAYIGDAVFEQKVRIHLLNSGIEKVEHLHQAATKYTSAIGQAKAYRDIEDTLTEEEIRIFKKGRNATSRKPTNMSRVDYQTATGFEALLGYLHLSHKMDRIDALLDKVFNT
ncbi:MAG: ribonuclease III domain-containing protein [Candidatus Izemoplasma sp.]|nr:ribonuclease III domain-containing protein [Candidatus Izemoplasma sp.]